MCSIPTLPFSEKALEGTLIRLEFEWEEYRSTRDRNAIYRYLTAVFEVVSWWEYAGKASEYSHRALAMRGHHLKQTKLEPFAAVIRCSAKTIDEKTQSKWSRGLRYAGEYKGVGESLQDFIKRKGGINSCAALYTRRLGRTAKHSAKIKSRRLFVAGKTQSVRP
jgi:predicted RNA-binding protein